MVATTFHYPQTELGFAYKARKNVKAWHIWPVFFSVSCFTVMIVPSRQGILMCTLIHFKLLWQSNALVLLYKKIGYVFYNYIQSECMKVV